ncbi:filamentous hemagglutinin N-terminal domain-containing protein [Desulfotalea psychrophila]|nr:filamentous hemagglutinin N-terminal domain-containing protein [Desulfotalea psychrophila]
MLANPTGGQVISGSASFNRSHNKLNVNQGSNSAIINWQDFSIGAGETTNFIQPSATSAVLNRVISRNPSQIYGNLTANGKVYLVNQNGILIGPSGVIDTKGFVASTLDVANEAFLAGDDMTFLGESGASVINLGKINAIAGDVLLIAYDVQNAGTITAKEGTVGLAAGSEILVRASGDQRIFIHAGASDGKVKNSGLIESASAELKAVGGNEFALAINNTGAVRATGSEERGGRIWLVSGTGTTENSGTLTAQKGDVGGTVQVLGDRVALTGTSVIDVSGASGGGTALVGGDYQGKNSTVKNATKTFVGKKTLITANAGYNGHGGKVIIWSDETTQFAGTISAKGGTENGDGGFAEVSGKKILAYQGITDLRAKKGKTGTLLLDPFNITIKNGSSENYNSISSTDEKFFTSAGTPSVLSVERLTTALKDSNVTVQTGGGTTLEDGNITVASKIGWSSDQNLTLIASNDIIINAEIASFDGNLTLNASNDININAKIVSVSGNLTLNADSDITLTGGAITLGNNGMVSLYNGSLTANADGNIFAGLNNSLYVHDATSFTSRNGSVLATSLANTFKGTVSATSGENDGVHLVNNCKLTLGTVSAGNNGLTLVAHGNITGSQAVGSAGTVNISTALNSNGSILLTGGFSSAGTVSLSADGFGSISIANVLGTVSLASADFGGSFTLGNAGTSVLILSDGDNDVDSDVVTGRGAGVVDITAGSIVFNDSIVTNAGNVLLTATSGGVNADDDNGTITTTATADTGVSSGSVTIIATDDVILKSVSTIGANNAIGVGSNAAAISVTSTGGHVTVTDVTATGGNATGAGHRNGGNAGNISLTAGTDKAITLNGNLSAIGGSYVGDSTQGLGGFIVVASPTVLTEDRLVTTGKTAGNITFESTIDSFDSTAKTLTLAAGLGDVSLQGLVGSTNKLGKLEVTSSGHTYVVKGITTTAVGGVGIDINATENIILGGNDSEVVLDTSAANGSVDLDASSSVVLDDSVKITHGLGNVTMGYQVRSAVGESGAHHLIIEHGDTAGAGGVFGDIYFEYNLGSSANRIGAVRIDGVNNLRLPSYVYASSLTYADDVGTRVLGEGAITYNTNYTNSTINVDGAAGVDIYTKGAVVTPHGAITSTVFGADVTLQSTTNTVTQNGAITTNAGAVTIDGQSGVLLVADDSDITTAGGAITLTSSAGVVTISGNGADLTSTGGDIAIAGIGVSQTDTDNDIDAGSGKICIDGGGGIIDLDGTLISTATDAEEPPAVLIHDASVVNISRVTAINGTLRIGEMVGAVGSEIADVTGSVIQQDLSLITDKINIKTLEVNAASNLSITDTNNIIDNLGDFNLGGSLTVQAKGRTNGLQLTGDVEATAVTIRTGLNTGGTDGILSLVTTNITATSGDVLLQGRGVTQLVGSTITAADQILILGSDYSDGTVQAVTLGGDLIAGSTATDAVVIDDTGNLIIANITAGTVGNRGGLRLGTNIDRDTTGEGAASGVNLGYTRIYGTVNQTADSEIKVGRLSIHQESGAVTLTNTGNEIKELGTISRGGAINILDADTEKNGLTLMGHMDGGTLDSAVTITTPGLLNLGGYLIYGSAVDLNGGSDLADTENALTSSGGGVYAERNTGNLTIDAGGSRIALSGALYALTDDKVIIENASDVSLGRVSRTEFPSGQIGELVLGTSGNVITGNVTQATGNIAADTISGVVNGSALLAQTNYVDNVSDFSAIDGFTLSNNAFALTVIGDLLSTNGDILLRTTGTNDDITVNSSASIAANTLGTGAVSLVANGLASINVFDSVTAGSGGVSIVTAENINVSGGSSIETTGGVELRAINAADNGYHRGIVLGGNISAGDDGVAIHSGYTINQSGGVITTSGALYGINSSGTTTIGAGSPSARGYVKLDTDNEIAELGPFYLEDAVSVSPYFKLNDVSGGLTLTGAITNPYGDIEIATAGGRLVLATHAVTAGSSINGGANISLKGRGIKQTSGSISVNGNDGQGGTILLQGHDGAFAGAINLAGTLQTYNTSANAITIRGTTNLTLPEIDVAGGILTLGGSDVTHQITGVVTQNAGTSIDTDILVVTAESSVVLTNVGNKVGSLGAVSVGDVGGKQYDFDLYDSIGGLTLTGNVTSAGGLQIVTAKVEGGEVERLELSDKQVRSLGDLYLSGEEIHQAATGEVNSAYQSISSDDAGTITLAGGDAAITLEGKLYTNNARATAVQLLNATDVTLHEVGVSSGTLVLGTAGANDITGIVSQDDGGVISAKTLVGDVGILALDETLNLDELGALITTGDLTLLDQGGTLAAAGLTCVGDVAAGGTTRIETSDGVLDFATFDLDANGHGLTLVGVGITQDFTVDTGVSDSAIKASTASIDAGTGSILLGSSSNDFTGQVGLTAAGAQVTIRDTDDLTLNANGTSLDDTLGDDTSILAIAGSQLILTGDAITTDEGSIDFRSLGGNLSTPGALTTGSGNVDLYSSAILTLSNSIASTSGDITIDGATVAHVSGGGYSLQTGNAGTITVDARTGNYTQGLDFDYSTVAGDITINALNGAANVANIQSTSGDLYVTTGGDITQQGGTAVQVATLTAKAMADGSITLAGTANAVDTISLRSRNLADDATGSGTIGYIDVDGVVIDQIETSGNATLTAGDAVSTGARGTIAANLLTVKTLKDAGGDITLTETNDVNSIDFQTRNAADSDNAAGEIRFTDRDGFSVTNVKTTDIAVFDADGAVTQTGAIIAAGLGLSGSGGYTLNNEALGTPINQVSTIASNATGDVNFSTALALTIGTVNQVGVSTGGANFALLAPSIDSSSIPIDTQSAVAGENGGSLTLVTYGMGTDGNLTVSDIITSGQDATVANTDGGVAGNVTLTAAGDVLSIGGALIARGGALDGTGADGADALVRLTAATGAVSQTDGDNEIKTGRVIVNAANTSELLDLTNTIDEISATLTGADADFTFKNAGDFTVGINDGGVIGLSTNSGNIALSGSGDVTLATDATVATTGGDFSTVGRAFTSNSGATITTSGGNVDLTGHTGAVLLGADVTTAGGDITATEITSFDSMAVTLSTTGGSDESGGNINITSTGAVSIGMLVADGGSDSNGSGESAGSITLAADAKLTTAEINAIGSDHNSDSTIGGQGGVITLTGTGGIDLGGNIDASGGGSGATQAAGGSVILNSPTLLLADRSIDTGAGAGDITFNGSVDSEATETNNLTLTAGTGNIVLSGAVGSTQELGVIQVVSATDVTTTSTLDAASLIQTAGSGTTTVNGVMTLSGNLDFTGQNLAVNAGVATDASTQVHNTGTFSSALGGDIVANGGFSQDGTGVNELSGDITTVNNDIIFVTAITLNDAVAMDSDSGAGNITFSRTVDSAVGETDDLTISSGSGDVSFLDTLGALEQLGAIVVNCGALTRFDKAVTATSVYTDAPGAVHVNGGSVTTTGTQIYLEQLVLGADTTLTATTVITGDTLTGNNHSLDINGNVVLGNSTDDQVTGLSTLAVTGTTEIHTDTVTSANAQTYTGAVILGNSTTLTATDNAVTFNSTVNSQASETNALAVNSGSGAATFSGAIGDLVDGVLGALGVNSSNETTFTGAVKAASLTTNAGGSTTINGGSIETTGAQNYNDAVVLRADTVLTSGGTVNFAASVNSDVGQNRDLTIDAAGQSVNFVAAVGRADTLNALTIVDADNVTFSNTIDAASLTQQAGSGTTTLNGIATLSGNLDFTGAAFNVNARLNSGGTVEATNAGVFTTAAASDIDAAGGFTQNGAGPNNLAGAITTVGTNINFTSAVELTGDVSMSTGTTAGSIGFASTVDSDADLTLRSLRLTSANAAGQNFVAAVGANHALNILRIESTGVTQGGSAPINAAQLAIKSTDDATLANTGNDIDTLAALLSGDAALVFVDSDGVEIGTIDSGELQIVGITDGVGTSNVTLTVGGLLSQSVGSVVAIDGDMTIDASSFDAGNVQFTNNDANGTVLDDTLIGGNFNLNSSAAITQKDGAYLRVGGEFSTPDGSFVEGSTSGNFIAGGTGAVAQGNEVRLFGVITLTMSSGNLVATATKDGITTTSTTINKINIVDGVRIISDAGGESITGVTDASAVTLVDNNQIGGLLKITTKGVYYDSGIENITGIRQDGTLNLAAASLVVQKSSKNNSITPTVVGEGALALPDTANRFSGIVSVSAINMDASIAAENNIFLGEVKSGSLTVNTSGTITQSGSTIIKTDGLSLSNATTIDLSNANQIKKLSANLVGSLSLTNAQALTVGQVASVTGITASGDVLLKTTSGDLVLDAAIVVTGASNITLVSAANFTNKAGAAGLTVPLGSHWQVWSADPTLDTLDRLTPNFKQYNATYGAKDVATGATGNGFLYSLDPSLVVDLQGTVVRDYDGTVDATLVQSNYDVSGLVGTDSVELSTSGTFNTKNADTKKNITVNPLSIVSAHDGEIVVYGYQVSSTDISRDIGTINKVALTLTPVTDTKTYDGTVSSSSVVTVAGAVAGDTVTVAEQFAYKDVMDANMSTLQIKSGYTIVDGFNNDMSGNYTITDIATAIGTINKADVTVTANSNIVTYNGLNQNVTGFTATGLVNSETLAVLTNITEAGGSGKNARTYSHTASGTDRNYKLTFVAGNLDINKADVIVTANSNTVTYNGLGQKVTGFTATGLMNSETLAVLTNVTEAGGIGKKAGTYSHTASGTDRNYKLTFVAGSLDIRQGRTDS